MDCRQIKKSRLDGLDSRDYTERNWLVVQTLSFRLIEPSWASQSARFLRWTDGPDCNCLAEIPRELQAIIKEKRYRDLWSAYKNAEVTLSNGPFSFTRPTQSWKLATTRYLALREVRSQLLISN